MKIRSDFVTNSSSSCYILSRKGDLSAEAKKTIIDFVKENMLGQCMLTPQSSEEVNEFFTSNWGTEEDEKKIRQALREGKSIYRWRQFRSNKSVTF